jgi:hypothetical protein
MTAQGVKSSTISTYIQDPGFEGGSPSAVWDTQSNGARTLIDKTVPHTGLWSAHLCQNTDNCRDQVSQGFTVPPAKVLSATLSYWFMVSTADPAAGPCNDYLAVGLVDANGVGGPNSGTKYCPEWKNYGYLQDSIDLTGWLNAHPGQKVYVVGAGVTDASGPSDYRLDDMSLTITVATVTSPPLNVVAEPDNGAATLRWQAPADNGGDPVSAYIVTPFTVNGTVASPQIVLNSPITTQVIKGLTNGTAYTFTVSASNGAGNSSPSVQSNSVIPLATMPSVALSNRQYMLSNSDGVTWTDIDPGALMLTVTATVNSQAIISGNADLWTASAGYNQDLGISISGGTGTGAGVYPTVAGQPEAWKESGGFAGTFSPNAAFVQTVATLNAGTTYTIKLQWKTNKAAPGTVIVAAAGLGPEFSPTRLTAILMPITTGLQDKASQAQFRLDDSNGVDWIDLGPSAAPSLTYTPAVNGTAILSANADLWTATAGYNQDLGIFVRAGTGPWLLVAWKESGGFAGTFSPNAAFVQTAYPLAAQTQYTFQLKWKTNRPAPGGAIFAGAGPIGGLFSPTRITLQFLAAGVPAPEAIITGQPSLSNSDGATWVDMDPALTTTFSVTGTCVAILNGNADLWTVTPGFNQDIAITVNGIVVGWKESGGFAGTFSPNAAFVQALYPMSTAGGPYTVKLQWKTNRYGAGSMIRAGAGPIGSNFSPTRLTVQLICVP